MTDPGRPRVVPDENSAPYWQAAAEHRLVLARCSDCLAFSHPPDSVCPYCGSTQPEFVFTPVSGRGVVKSWTVVRRSFLPGFDLPFVLVDVELVEQDDLRLIGRLLLGAELSPRVGDAVTLAFEDVAPGFAVPGFALEVGG